jgi:hypothetical protein
MNDEINIEDLLAGLEIEPSPTASRKMKPRLKPGDIDAVDVHLDEDEVSRLAVAGPNPDVIQAILSDHKNEFEYLCHYHIDEQTMYTLDVGSLEIQHYETDHHIERGFAHCEYTASKFLGCDDWNDDCDPRDCVLDVALHISNRTIIVSTQIPDYERDPDEY